MKTVVFILSCDRSGSTWLGYVLGSHSRCAFVGEYYRAWHPELWQFCALCLANGKTRCDVLDGIESVPAEFAFDFAFDRLNTDVVIDISKRVYWAERYTTSDRYRVRLIHLIRDPRGWYESQRRREHSSIEDLIGGWHVENSHIESFIAASGLPSVTVFYDELAARPRVEIRKVVNFLGLPFESDALCYWTKAHHGFAANGASSPLLNRFEHAGEISTFVTGADDFYRQHGTTLFVDERWKTDLQAEEKRLIESDQRVVSLLGAHNRVLLPDGIARYVQNAAPQAGT